MLPNMSTLLYEALTASGTQWICIMLSSANPVIPQDSFNLERMTGHPSADR